MTTKYLLSFHTIFILDENIQWLEEFIKYYLYLGFDHLYLYDNEHTSGGDGTSTINKYGFPISVENTENSKQTLQKILDIYGSHITYVKWQPKDKDGKVIYGQTEGIQHFIDNYGNETEWVAFMDLDEYIFSEQNIDIREYLTRIPSNISCVKIVQKKFKDRFLINGHITQNYECINKEIGFDWAPKNIVRCSDFLCLTNIHEIKVKYETRFEKPDVLRFNHYNVNDKLLKWMKGFYKSPTDFSLDGIDDGMKRYRSLLSKDGSNTQLLLLILIGGGLVIWKLFPKIPYNYFMKFPQNIYTKKKI